MSHLHERIVSWSKIHDLNTRNTAYETKTVIKLLEDALAGLRPSLSNTTPPAGDTTIINNFGGGVPQPDDKFYWWTPGDLQAADTTRSAGITWRTINTAPDRMSFQAGLTERYYLSDYLRTAVGSSLGFSEAHYEFDETQSYATSPTAATWRGLDVAGTIAVGAVAGTSTQNAILNGSMDTWVAGSGGTGEYTAFWAANTNDGNIGKATGNPAGGFGMYLNYNGDSVSTNVIVNHAVGSAAAISQPYSLSSTASTRMPQGRTWVLQWDMKNIGPAAVKFRIALIACSSSTFALPLDSTYAGLSSSVTLDASATQAFNITATQAWTAGTEGVVELQGVPADSTWRTYTITFATTSIAATVADPFYPRLLLENTSNGGATHALLVIDNIGLTTGAATIIASNLTERALTLDQFQYAPTLTASGDTISFPEVTGAYLVPTLAPAIAAGGVATLVLARGAVSGFALSGSATGVTATDVFSHYMLVPGFGTNAHGLGLADTTGSFFTAFRTGAQAAAIRYRLPLAAPSVSGQVLAADTAGVMIWANAGNVPNPTASQPLFFEVDNGTEELWMLGIGAAASGSVGPGGPVGPQGRPGPPALDGEDGSDGAPGQPGSQGAQGLAGTAGTIGPPGTDGEEGPEGMPIPGPAGAAGVAGAPGPPTPGPPGLDGEDGIDGRTGLTGATGFQGLQGPPGMDGADDDNGFGLLGISRDMIRSAGGVNGSGTLNTIAKWTPDGFTLGNSLISESGTNITLGIVAGAPGFAALLPSFTTGADLGSDTLYWNTIYASHIASSNSGFDFNTANGAGGFNQRYLIPGGANLVDMSFTFLTSMKLVNPISGDPTVELRFLEPAASGTTYTGFRAGVMAANITYTWPTVVPTANQVLASSGGASSTLSWVTPSAAASVATAIAPCLGFDSGDSDIGWALMGIPSGLIPASGIGGSGTANKVAKWSAATTLTNSLIWDDGTNVNVGQVGSTTGKLAVMGSIASENPGAAFILQPGGAVTYSLTANGGLGGISRTESVPLLAPTVNGAVKTATTAGQQSWTSVLPVANGGTGSAMGAAAIAPCLCGNDYDGSDVATGWEPWTSILNVSGTDISLPNGMIRSEIAATTALGMVFQTKSNTGAFVNRMTIASGNTAALTQLNFNSVGIVNFNSAALGGLVSIAPVSGGNGTIGTNTAGTISAWGTAYIVNLVGGDDFNGTDFTLKVADGAGSGTSVTLLTVPLTASPQVATWAPDMVFTRKLTKYSNVTTAGWGVPAVYAAGRFAAQTAAKTTVSTYTVGAADGSFEISANVNVTTSTTHSFTVTCSYTDESNAPRVLTLGFTQLSGATLITVITNVTGAGPYESPVYHVRCKASTAITIGTSATVFTSITYNIEGIIKQTA